MKLHPRSIRVKLWTAFVAFSALILIILWILQVGLVAPYYKMMRKRDMIRINNTIVAYYQENQMTGIRDLATDLAYRYGICIVLQDNQRNTVASVDMMGGNCILHSRSYSLFEPDPIAILYRLLDRGAGYFFNRADNQVTSRVMYISGMRFDGGAIFLNADIQPLDTTQAIWKDQLMLVSLIVIVLSMGMAFLMASYIANPFHAIIRSARKLAQGNFAADFKKGGYEEIDELADTLNYAAAELCKVENLRRDLVANVSHDLRTPLTMIKAYAEMIRDLSGENPAKRGEHLKVIIDETNRLSVLVTDLLSLSRLEAGTVQLEPKEFDIARAARALLERFGILRETEGYHLIYQGPDSRVVFGDPRKIEQAIYNLVSNAVNHAGGDKAVILRVIAGEKETRVEVEDHGAGIAPDEIDKIWRRYYKSSKSGGKRIIGTGLGLSIVKGNLDLHHARYGVNSREGEGSVFYFVLKE